MLFKRAMPAYVPYLAFGCFILLGTVLRVIPLEARDFWYDEAFTGILVRQPWDQMMQLILKDVHPPLYYWVLALWGMVFGTTMTALRAFSVTCGVATIGAVFFALKSWYKPSTVPAMLGALFVAINPFFVNYSQEARMYALFGLLVVVAAMLLVRAWETGSYWVRLCFSLVFFALPFTHYIGIFFCVGFALADMVHENAWGIMKHPREALKTLVATYAFPCIGGGVWLPSFLLQAQAHDTLGWVPSAPLHVIGHTLHIFLFGAPVGVQGVPPALGYRVSFLTVEDITFVVTVGLVALVTYLFVAKKMDDRLALTGFMTAFPLCATLIVQLADHKLYVERYLTGAAVFLMLFFALAIGRMRTRFMVLIVGGYIVLVCLVRPWSYGVRTFTDLHAFVSRSDRTVVMADPFDYIMARYYQGEGRSIRLYQEAHAYERLTGWALIRPEDQIQELPKTPHLFLTHHPERYTSYHVMKTVGDVTILQSL